MQNPDLASKTTEYKWSHYGNKWSLKWDILCIVTHFNLLKRIWQVTSLNSYLQM